MSRHAYGAPLREMLLAKPGDHLFRVEAVSYSYVTNEWGDYASTPPRLEVFTFPVHKWTEHGATLELYSGARRKWVDLRENAKQWASQSVWEATNQLRLRRKRQIHILTKQLARAQHEMELCERAL